MDKYKLGLDKLKNECNTDLFDFETTEEVDNWEGIIGQQRAIKALEFGMSIYREGYNIYVSGLNGTGRNSYSYSLAKEHSKLKNNSKDWCYVYSFQKPENPKAISLKKGKGKIFKKEMGKLIDILKEKIPENLSSKNYEEKLDNLYKNHKQIIQKIINELNNISKEYDFKFEYTEKGIVTFPIVNGKPMSKAQLNDLDEEEIKELKAKSNNLQSVTFDIIEKLKNQENNLLYQISYLEKSIVSETINTQLKSVNKIFEDNKKIIKFLEEVKIDIIENYDRFKNTNTSDSQKGLDLLQQKANQDDFFIRYEINLFIDNSRLEGEAVIRELNPTYHNLLGKIEYVNQLGVLKTDHTKIKPGSLHEANCGYIIIQAKDILKNKFAWEGLKRSLKSNQIKIENVFKESLLSQTLKPEPITLDVKVIIIGDHYIYQLLYANDEDFKKLFRIRADFDIEMKRTEKNMKLIAKFISYHCKKNKLLPFNKDSIGKIIEYSSRLARDQKKLTCRFNYIVELLYEADALARWENENIVNKDHIKQALDSKIYRNNQYETKLHELFKEGTLLIETNGYEIGQINGLAVLDSGEYSFGRPNRITVSTFVGEDGIVSIEREVEQSGSSYDKGVLILNGYIGSKFAKFKPLSLSASITFEQSYGIINGDSASSTELYALLSSLSDIPINQAIAVTGSINQKGEIQPIGGVNEKIEGYYKVCKTKGLLGGEGVIIPHQNVTNLMLSDEVMDSVRQNKFSIYSIKTVDEGIEILTGVKAGKINENGEYPENSVYYKVSKKLSKFVEYTKDK